MNKIEIEINGKPVNLTEFPAKIIINAIVGMLISLRDVDTVENAIIRIERDPD